VKGGKVKKIFAILFALVLVVSLTFGGCTPTPQGPTTQLWDPDVDGEVTFFQLCWMASPEEALYPHSNVGAVEFTFLEGAGDWLLDEYGGGWLNVVIDTTADGGSRQWAVQNLYLTYQDLDYLLGSTPSVQFSLGLDGNTSIESLDAAVFLSSGPIEEQPEAEELFPYTVSHMPYLVGGRVDGGSGNSTIPLTIGPFVGSTAKPVRTARIKPTLAGVVPIDEGHNGCAPAAAARSLAYLGVTTNPQDTYSDLYNRMHTNPAVGGTTDGNLLAGKNDYCGNHTLNITSKIVYRDTYNPSNGYPYEQSSWNDLMEEVKDALEAGCDVELLISLSGGGGHVAMVVSVTDYEDGSATIAYVDDPSQGDGVAQNDEHEISTDNAGNFAGGTVDGFMIEKKG
jgi:hypothetical protein